MILQKLISNKNSKKFFLSIGIVFAIALTVVGRATFGGVVSEYNMHIDVFPAGGDGDRVQHRVHAAVSIPLGFFFLGSDRQD